MSSSPLGMAYRPLFFHLETCPTCSKTPTMCITAQRLVYACALQAAQLLAPIPPIKVPS